MEASDEKDYAEKEKVFYSAMISAWLNTKLERDKQLLTLSSTAIGLLVTLMRTMGVSDILQLWLYISSLSVFLITIVSIIYILGENSSHIENILNGNDIKSRKLMVADRVATTCFIIGLVIVIIIGVNSAVHELAQNEVIMNHEEYTESKSQQSLSKSGDIRSWNGLGQLRPKPPKAQPVNTENGNDTDNSSDSDDNNTDNSNNPKNGN